MKVRKPVQVARGGPHRGKVCVQSVRQTAGDQAVFSTG
jgi:hypothetical protein